MAFHLSGTIAVPTGDLERVRAALPEHRRLTLAEPGCRAFTVEENADGVFAVNETFDDEAAFVAHQARLRGTAWAEASANAVRDYRTWRDEAIMQTNSSMPASIVIPQLPYASVVEAAAWLERVFGLSVRVAIGDHRIQMTTPEGGHIVVVQGEGRASIMVRVADVEAVRRRAIAEGAQVLGEPETYPYGERQFIAVDCGGHAWKFSQTVADVTPESWGGATGPGLR